MVGRARRGSAWPHRMKAGVELDSRGSWWEEAQKDRCTPQEKSMNTGKEQFRLKIQPQI